MKPCLPTSQDKTERDGAVGGHGKEGLGEQNWSTERSHTVLVGERFNVGKVGNNLPKGRWLQEEKLQIELERGDLTSQGGVSGIVRVSRLQKALTKAICQGFWGSQSQRPCNVSCLFSQYTWKAEARTERALSRWEVKLTWKWAPQLIAPSSFAPLVHQMRFNFTPWSMSVTATFLTRWQSVS